MTLRINIASVFVTDQAVAEAFYVDKLGFEKRQDVSLGEYRWLTVGTPGVDNIELLLEPNAHRAVPPYMQALKEDGIAATSFAVDDVAAEVDRLKALGVHFTQETLDVGPAIIAVLDDTCGNLIQLNQLK